MKGCRLRTITQALAFKHATIPTKQTYRMTSWLVWMKMHETVKNKSNAMDRAQRPESRVHGDAAGASVLRKKTAWRVVGGTLRMMGYACPCKKYQ